MIKTRYRHDLMSFRTILGGYNMNKEDMINILNQHGLNGLYTVIEDELGKVFDAGYDLGYEDGCFESIDCDNNLGTKLLS